MAEKTSDEKDEKNLLERLIDNEVQGLVNNWRERYKMRDRESELRYDGIVGIGH